MPEITADSLLPEAQPDPGTGATAGTGMSTSDTPRVLPRETLAVKLIREGITSCRRDRMERLDTWQTNVAFRKGHPFDKIPESDTVNVPADWSLTKNKQAQIFFQAPEVKLTARRPEYKPVAPLAASALNFQLQHEMQIHYTMDECLADAINASGIAFAFVSYQATFEEKQVPAIDVQALDPEFRAFAESNPDMGLIPMTTQKVPVYECYACDRISPARALYPVEHRRSDWKKAPWLGYEGFLPIAEAVRRRWVPEGYEGEEIAVDELCDDETPEGAGSIIAPGLYVKYCAIFYYAAHYDPQQKHPHAIRRMILIEGLQNENQGLVLDEPLPWQRYVPGTILPAQDPNQPPTVIRAHYQGMTSLPIKVATLTTISDCAIPPSDSEMGRPQVKEMIRSRSQMIRQREHSLPIRWFDVNMVDEEIAQQLRAGIIQDMIPMNGPGDKAIGEVARANYPRENFEFMRVFQTDLNETWSMGANQQGYEQAGDQSATEAKIVQGNANTRLDYERVRWARFFVEIAEATFGLMQLFTDHDEYVEVLGIEGTKTLERWNKDLIPGRYLFEVRPDASTRVDINQKKQEILGNYKLLRRDPLINPQAAILEFCEVYGYDPARWLAKPKEPDPTPANVRYSFKGEDLLTPMAVALLQKSPTPITPKDIEAAKKLIADSLAMSPSIGAALPASVDVEGGPGSDRGGTEGQHPGPTEDVQTLDKRYERGGNIPKDHVPTPSGASTGGGS